MSRPFLTGLLAILDMAILEDEAPRVAAAVERSAQKLQTNLHAAQQRLGERRQEVRARGELDAMTEHSGREFK